jgi:5-methylcytosine-specific restriction protein B
VPSITTVVAQALHTAATVLREDAPQDGMVFGELWDRILTRSPGLGEGRTQAMHDSPQEANTPFKNYVNRSASNLVRAGWLYRGGRRWQLTGIGADALDRIPDPVDFYLEATRRYRRWERRQREVSAAATALEQLPDGGYRVALTDGFETYFGVVGGPATHSAERLERPVEWRNLNKPLDFLKDLPSGRVGTIARCRHNLCGR